MIAIPAVDIREGACVQLVGGSYDAERIRIPDPAGIARAWTDAGFTRLHVVDLDAATGRGSNERIVRDLIGLSDMLVQVGGGVRSEDAIERLLRDGAEYVVVGTRAIEEPDWLHGIATQYPGEIIVAADVRERRVVTHGWEKLQHRDILDVIADLNDSPLGGVLVTAVHKEGQMRGTDLFLMEDVAEECAFPVLASGGITTMNDLRALAERGIAGAVIGMALYTGALDPRAVSGEFCE
ncbi:MAG TPA: 1-(5-phosphoribosyl)-5-[(5-phosphoribosylamino)methylideneamino] imidazole-4-carboxamide isomerase [Gemmatimonadaceae bacterium]|nr:1-(5-phosphoribosyl)-5-[(5-phosphoribosylamino)methylideneamino] imidazole-4-carboxamide isomerase [Gemmatimonadaceae bacterium]